MTRAGFKTILITALSIITAGCSDTDRTDHSAYAEQGTEAARMFVKHSDRANELQTIDLLLEINSTIAQIIDNDGQAAADTFRMAFETYLRQHNDSLYRLVTVQEPSTTITSDSL